MLLSLELALFESTELGEAGDGTCDGKRSGVGGLRSAAAVCGEVELIV